MCPSRSTDNKNLLTVNQKACRNTKGEPRIHIHYYAHVVRLVLGRKLVRRAGLCFRSSANGAVDKMMHAGPWAKLSMDLDALVCMHRLRRLLEVNFVSPSKLRCCANSLKQFTYPSFAWLLLPGVVCPSVYAGAVFAPTYPVWQAPTKSTGRKASPYRATIDASSRI